MIIVDANTWAMVFDVSNMRHRDFQPVKDYIESTPRSLAWGGSSYVAELRNCPRYQRIHLELMKGSRAVRFADDFIDKEETRIRSLEASIDFDDPHIIAIQVVSKAPIICSVDKRAYPYYKKKALYPRRHPMPKIYSKRANRRLLKNL